MKTIIYILLYIFLTIGYYLLLSLIGLLFFKENGDHFTYVEITGNAFWFVFYLVLFHWWLVMFSLTEYWDKYMSEIWD